MKVVDAILARARYYFWRGAHMLMRVPLVFAPIPKRVLSTELISTSITSNDWHVHDERWSRVVHRWADRAACKSGGPIVRKEPPPPIRGQLAWSGDSEFSVSVEQGTADRWVYVNLNPQEVTLGDFEWAFNVVRYTAFQELQFGFRYLDFYNRYRLRHERGRISFDIVRNGVFYNDLAVRKFRMEIGRPYEFVIRMRGRRFWLLIDGRLALSGGDPLNIFPRGGLACIFWESQAHPPIKLAVSEMSVRV